MYFADPSKYCYGVGGEPCDEDAGDPQACESIHWNGAFFRVTCIISTGVFIYPITVLARICKVRWV